MSVFAAVTSDSKRDELDCLERFAGPAHAQYVLTRPDMMLKQPSSGA